MFTVIGLMLVLGILADILFLMALGDNRLAVKNAREMQERLLGKAGLSWALARLTNDTSLFYGIESSMMIDTSEGFAVSLEPEGILLDAYVTPKRKLPSSLHAHAWIGNVMDSLAKPPVLSLMGSSDLNVRGSGIVVGSYFALHGLVNAGYDARTRENSALDSNAMPDWMKRPWALNVLVKWQKSTLAALMKDSTLDSTRPQLRKSGNVSVEGKQLPERTELHVHGLLRLRNVSCDNCIILADSIHIEGKTTLRAGMIWTSGSLWAHKAIFDGYGQILANDTLALDSCEGGTRQLVFASLGESTKPPIGLDSASSGMLRLTHVNLEGMAFSLGVGGAESMRLIGDSTSFWKGIWGIRGTVQYAGTVMGQVRMDGVRWVAPNGVIWNGQTDGKFLKEQSGKRCVLPLLWKKYDKLGLEWWRFERL